MSLILRRVVLGVAGAMLVSSSVIAQDVPEVTVEAKRLLTTKVTEHMEGGVPIQDVSVSYGVRTSDLDLSTHSAAMVLEQRVKDAAKMACKEISRRFPQATPGVSECAKTTAEKAMPQVNQLVASAEKARSRG